MALTQNNGGSDSDHCNKQPLAPKPNTAGPQSSEYSAASQQISRPSVAAVWRPPMSLRSVGTI